MDDTEQDAIESEVYAEEAAKNERRGIRYDLPGMLSAIAAKRRACQSLTPMEAAAWAEYENKAR